MTDKEYQQLGSAVYGVGGFTRLIIFLRSVGEIADGAKNPQEIAKTALEKIGLGR